MKAYMISLNDAKEKIEYLNSFGIEVNLVKGVNGKAVSNEEINKRVSNTYKTFGPKSAIGCAISHMNVWKLFLETEEEYAIIFEDDVVLEDNFNEKLEVALREVPKDYDILYLGCTGCDNTQPVNIVKILASIPFFPQTFNPDEKVTDNISRPSVAFATHAYIVSRKGATKLLKYLDGKLSNHIDFSIQKLVLNNKIESYVTTPRIAYQTSSDDTKSESVSSNYPLVLTKILDQIYVEKLFRAKFLFTVSYFRIGNININLITLLFFILGIICMLKNIDIRKITFVFLLFCSPDIVLIKNRNDIQVILFNYFVLIFPSILKMINNRGK